MDDQDDKIIDWWLSQINFNLHFDSVFYIYVT